MNTLIRARIAITFFVFALGLVTYLDFLAAQPETRYGITRYPAVEVGPALREFALAQDPVALEDLITTEHVAIYSGDDDIVLASYKPTLDSMYGFHVITEDDLESPDDAADRFLRDAEAQDERARYHDQWMHAPIEQYTMVEDRDSYWGLHS